MVLRSLIATWGGGLFLACSARQDPINDAVRRGQVRGRRSRTGAGQPLGSFNLYGRTRSAFDTIDAEILDLLTSTVSRSIGDYARFKSANEVAESIQRALATRGPIEQAKGMLMAIHGIDADQAFDRLRTQSQNTNTPLSSVAAALVEQIRSTTTNTSGS